MGAGEAEGFFVLGAVGGCSWGIEPGAMRERFNFALNVPTALTRQSAYNVLFAGV
jgi:hypothetical protein